jgi:hypothetical protein
MCALSLHVRNKCACSTWASEIKWCLSLPKIKIKSFYLSPKVTYPERLYGVKIMKIQLKISHLGTFNLNVELCRVTFLEACYSSRQANFFSKSANRKILGLIPQLKIRNFLRCARLQIVNSQSFMIYLQIANMQISTKYCITLSQNSNKSRLFKTIFGSCMFESHLLYLCFKGSLHEIFDFKFFSWISVPQAPK